MITPPLLIAGACVLWAVQTGEWLVAAAIAIALESARIVPVRWSVTQAHFNRLSDFCSVLLLAVAAYLYLTFGNPRAILLLFQWLPVVLLPLALAQAWGNRERIGIAAFVWNLRKDPAAGRHAINLGYPWLLSLVLAAAAANTRGPAFYCGLVILAGWALWRVRPGRHARASWIGLVALAAALGYGGQYGLARLQGWIENAVPEWIAGSGSRTDPYRSRTDMGHIGQLKLDDAIVLRVRPDAGMAMPLLLHRASYNGYFGGTWVTRNAPLVPRLPDAASRWVLAPAASASLRVAIADYSPRGNPVLSLPHGTVEVTGLAAPEIKVNALGALQAESPPGHFSYTAAVAPRAAVERSPDDDDLRIPRGEQALFARLVQALGLDRMGAAAAVAGVRQFFERDFGYATWQPAADRGPSPLARFLLETRAGHCEYFATATALLLRAAGVPARYATGFSAQEWSRLEGAYIVRERHAHAWVRAWVDGAWIEVDTTPADWARVEAIEASWFAPAADLWSWAHYRISRLVAGARGAENAAALWTAIALVLAGWLGWRLYRQRQLLVIGTGASPRRKRAAAGADSEFYAIERALARAGYPRERDETVMAWLSRIAPRLPGDADPSALVEIARLHYRYRFDPAGLGEDERARLTAESTQWLARSAGTFAHGHQPQGHGGRGENPGNIRPGRM